MLERLRQLEDELAGVRDTGKREELLRELSALATRVEVASRRVSEDERALGEIGRSIERMRASIGGAPKEEPAPTAAPPPAPSGVWVVAAAVVVVAGVFGAMAVASGKKRAAVDLSGPAIAGFPHAIEPTALVAAARDEARLGKDARLTGIHVDYAGASGRVDVRAVGYEGRITYSFIAPLEPVAAPPSSAPLGAPPPLRPMPRTATIVVSSTGMSSGAYNLSLSDEGVADPQCTVAQVWAAARERGAPPEAIAVLEYGAKQVFESGHFHNVTRWSFTIRGTRIAFDIADPGCSVIDTSPKL